MFAKLFMLDCLTNLHVGNGDVNFNVIDNEVERDPVTGYPTIHASGVKGALRAYCQNGVMDTQDVNEIFGQSAGNTSQGRVKFLCANLLARPMRATKGSKAYYMVTTPDAMKLYKSLTTHFLGQVPPMKEPKKPGAAKGIEAEGFGITAVQSPGSYECFSMREADYRQVSLPVVARNSLGTVNPKNLWYEEIVPHESKFYFFALSDEQAQLEKLAKAIRGQIIQFGGNASVGCGYCLVTEITTGEGGAAHE